MLQAAPSSLLGLPLTSMGGGRNDTSSSETWPLRDYVSPGLAEVRPDACFPHMRAGDPLHHPWKYLRRDVPHTWYVDDRFPLMGFMNRDEATLLHNIALQFRRKRVLEIGSWLGWSTCHIAMAGTFVDVIDPAHSDPEFRSIVEESLARCGVSARVRLTGGRSPDNVHELAAVADRKWSLIVIDGDHEGSAPLRDTVACLPFADADCAFVFHDLASPDVAAALRFLEGQDFKILVYQTAQVMGIAWRGKVTPPPHLPDPDVAWQLPHHLVGLPVSGVDFSVRSPTPLPENFEPEVHPALLPVRVERSFPDVIKPATSTATVCVVTNEIIGPFKNGGIGTAMTGLAETLARAGHRVTILYTGNLWNPDSGLARWKTHYAASGITLVSLDAEDMRGMTGPVNDCGFGAPWLIFQFLRANHFDVVHFNDCCGEGHLALAAKKLGLAFQQTLLVVAMHSPSQWVLELNHALPANLLLAAYHYAEHLSVRCADVVWSPSRYMLEWARQHDFILPAATFVQQYALPGPSLPQPVAGKPTQRPDTIVFFGRLEERKGLRLFCNALDHLNLELAAGDIAVVFLGKPASMPEGSSLDYIASRSRHWRFAVKTITTLGQPEALAYLQSGAKLAVMPSPLDNSPCTVYEALACGLPFLAARTGGIGELIHEDDKDRVLFDYSTPALRTALLRAIHDGGFVARPSMTQAESKQRWATMHANWQGYLSPPAKHVAADRDVVAIIEHRAGMNLDATMRSLENCEGVRRAVVLNRSRIWLTGLSESLPTRVIDLSLEDASMLEPELDGVAGSAVLFIHSGVVVNPEPFASMRKSLECDGIDGLIPAARLGGAPPRIVLPLGGSAAFSLFQGVTFTGGLLVRGDSMVNARGNRSLVHGSAFMGLPDFCVPGGTALWPWPETVFDCPRSFDPRDHPPLPGRVAAYDDASAIDRYYMLSTGFGAVTGLSSTGGKRRLAVLAADLGFGTVLRAGLRGLKTAKRLWSRLRGRQ